MIKPDDFLHKILSTEGEQATVDKAFRFVFLVLILGLSCSMPAYATGPSMDVFDTEDAPSDRQPAEPATDEESPGTSHDAAQPGDEAPSDAAVQKPRFPIWGVIDNPVKDKANIREGAWSERDKVGRVQNGVKVEILGESKGWYKVKVGSTTGWIRKKKINTGENAKVEQKPFQGQVSTSLGSGLTVRSAPGGDSVGRLKAGQKLELLGRDGRWFMIRYKGKIAYVPKDSIDRDLGSTRGKTRDTSGDLPASIAERGKKLLGWLEQAGFKGDALRVAWAVGMRESCGDPALGPGHPDFNGCDYGLFQFNKPSWGNEDWWDDKKLLDPVYNARILYKMTRGGTYWKPWGLTADGKAMDASCLPDVEQREAAGMDLEQLQEILRHVSTIVCCKN